MAPVEGTGGDDGLSSSGSSGRGRRGKDREGSWGFGWEWTPVECGRIRRFESLDQAWHGDGRGKAIVAIRYHRRYVRQLRLDPGELHTSPGKRKGKGKVQSHDIHGRVDEAFKLPNRVIKRVKEREERV